MAETAVTEIPHATGGTTGPIVNVQRFINEQRFSGFQWLIFAMCFVIVLLDGFDTAAIGFIAPSLLTEWHLTRPALSPVLSAALFGLACGALAAGPLSDHLGRRALLIGAVLVFGCACVASAFSTSLTQLTVLRFLTGLGLGAAMPNAATMMSEFCPDRRRATIVNLMFCGFPLGAAVGGFFAAWLIPHFGWRSVLIVGGGAPLLLVVALSLWLPESVRHMVAHRYASARIAATLNRIAGTGSITSRHAHPAMGRDDRTRATDALSAASIFVMTETATPTDGRGGLRLVLSRHYLLGSVMLWLAYFMGLVIFYASINWMPLLFKEAGLGQQRAALISALFPLGGVGAVLCGVLMDKFNATRIIAACYALTAVSMYCIGKALGNVGLLTVAVFAAGVLMNTAQSSMPALAAAFYPTQGRATGIAWMLGIGRFGGIAGSFLVAELARQQFTISGIYAVVAIAGVLSCLALLIKEAVARGGALPPLAKSESLGH